MPSSYRFLESAPSPEKPYSIRSKARLDARFYPLAFKKTQIN
jgi:hypothetical protein